MRLAAIKYWIVSLFKGKDEMAYLREYDLLQDLTPYELKLFSHILHKRFFKEGEYVYREDNPLAVVYLIEKGSIEVNDVINDNSIPVVLGDHQMLGLVDMYVENRRKGTAKALKCTNVLAIPRDDFNEFIRLNPRTGVKILTNIARSFSHEIMDPRFTIEIAR